MSTEDDVSEERKFNGYYHYHYETSSIFDTLKNTQERIQVNYSTEQYLNALDNLLFRSVEPILRSCSYLDNLVAALLAWYADSSRYRISRHDKEETISRLMCFVVAVSPDSKLALLKDVHFDRNILMTFTDMFLKACDAYQRDCESLAGKRQIKLLLSVREHEALMGHDPALHSSLYAAVKQSRYWLNQAITLRSMVLEKYYRLIITEGRGYYEAMKYSVDLSDTIQSMVVEACRALDKCDQQKGTLTTYLRRWVHGVRGKPSGLERDTAYAIPSSARDSMIHKSVPLSDLEEELESLDGVADNNEDILSVRQIARIADPTGLARFEMGIEEYAPALKCAEYNRVSQ